MTDGITFDPPGKGPWELEATHFCRPATRFGYSAWRVGFVKGFSEGTARYGLLLDHLEPGLSNGFVYMQPRPFGAPAGAMRPPPTPVLKLLTRFHPKLRARIATSQGALGEKLWRADLEHWDKVDKPAAIAKHRAIQRVDVESLSDAGLAGHIASCREHVEAMHYLHHKYTIASTLPVGDLLAGCAEWTTLSPGEVLRALRGTSAVSKGFAAGELDAAAKAIAISDTARDLLNRAGDPETILAALASDDVAGPDVNAYLDAVRHRSVGYDLGDQTAGELPVLLLGALRSAVSGVGGPAAEGDELARVRAAVPPRHLEEFEERLAEALLINRLRDERGVYSDGWATGLARRALLEAGRRLRAKGLLAEAEHAVELDADEAALLLRGEAGPGAGEVAERFTWRTTHTIDDAPPILRATPPPPPPVSLLPPAARRPALAVGAVLDNLFKVPEPANTDTVLRGLAVNSGSYQGTARLVHDAADFGRIQQGDVLVTRMTSPYFNVVLPLLGALVTDRGGQLCHAAIVAREYGIPGVVGTREATARIPDGAQVHVDGTTGQVRLVS